MNAVCPNCQCDINPRIDQQLRSGSPHANGRLCRQQLKFANRKISLAKLYVIHSGVRGFRNLLEQPPPPIWVIVRELHPIGDVVEKQEISVAAAKLAASSRIESPMPLSTQIVWLFVLAIPIASVAWTITHEEVFREPREYCVRCSQECRSFTARKFFYLFTCEYCFSHYVTVFFVVLTRYKLLFQDWRGYIISLFALVWVANLYMTLFANIRVDLKIDRFKAQRVEKELEQKQRELDEPVPVTEHPAA
jgi:hypothetical protein